jgi:DNA (cytosine-5)-methyltransferase 1
MLKVVDLCAGTGAFSWVFNQSEGFNVVFANDFSMASKKIYEHNIGPDHFNGEDIMKLKIKDIPPHDVLCAGFPCQPFSICGERKGFDDERSNVFWKITEILRFHQPRFIILENVKNIKSHDKGRTFKIISDEITKLGYYFKLKILDTALVTQIPHHRERVYIVCFKDKKLCDRFDLDLPMSKSKQSIRSILEPKVDNKYYYTQKLKVYDVVAKDVTKSVDDDVVYQYRRHYVRENKNKNCPTLTANMGKGGHNVPLIKDEKGIRKLTPRECFNLQGFPKSYELPDLSDNDLYTLAGNAVTVPIVEAIVNKLSKIIH